eukprot:CAMPEP_0179994630 /NCGR_PEP_ID=MMETSP0984-20121128/6660_1 /TAXON_ID=483367 /ORGANISM="non described non described, Strain CCMP 2436" /LENGTH=38 /DNA_ID= /DNA_START= /DNA_END= /DNA_ORIENTATION=
MNYIAVHYHCRRLMATPEVARASAKRVGASAWGVRKHR